jgi:hypothetical protein
MLIMNQGNGVNGLVDCFFLLANPHSSGKPSSPTEYFIGAAFFAVVACWSLILALHPKWRGTARWGKGGRGGPMSLIGSLACVLSASLFSIALLVGGLQYSLSWTFWLMTGGVAVMMTAAIRDAIHNRKR